MFLKLSQQCVDCFYIQNRYRDNKLCLTLYRRAEEKAPNTEVWNRNKYTPLTNTTNNNGTAQKFENLSNSLKTAQQQKLPGNRNSSQHIKTTSQTSTSQGQWPVKSNTASRSLQDPSLAYKFNNNIQQNKINGNQLDCVPEDKSQVNSWRELIGRKTI